MPWQAAEKFGSQAASLIAPCRQERSAFVLVQAAAAMSSLAMRSRLYAAPTRYEVICVRSSPLKRVLRKFATVLVQPKLSSTRFRMR